MIQVDFGMHVGVEEVTGVIVGKVFDIIIKPIEEGFTLCLIDDFFIWLLILFLIVIEIVFWVDDKSETKILFTVIHQLKEIIFIAPIVIAVP